MSMLRVEASVVRNGRCEPCARAAHRASRGTASGSAGGAFAARERPQGGGQPWEAEILPQELAPAPRWVLQRKCSGCAADDGDSPRRRPAPGENLPPGQVPPIVDEVLQSGGRPLDASARAAFEPRFGRTFGDVRIHDGARADESARAVRAEAYTVGSDVVFRRGAFAPGTAAGERLLAHELAHVAERPPLSGGASSPRVIQRQPEEEEGDDTAHRASEEAGRRALETMTLITMQQNAEWLAQREFSPDDPKVQQAAPEEAKKARAAFDALAPAREGALGACASAKAELEQEGRRISDKPPADRTAAEDELIERLPLAFAALEEFAAQVPLEITLKEGGIKEAEERAKQVADELGAVARVGGVSRARSAIGAYAKALARYRAAKAALRDALQKKGMLGRDGNVLPCVKKGATHPESVSDAHLEKIKKGEGFAPLPYKALEGACTIGYGHVIGRPPCPKPEEPPSDKPCCSPGGPPVPVGTRTVEGCQCSPPLGMDEGAATAQLRKDLNAQGKWIKEHVMVDLDQAHFDALVDLGGHVGSIPVDLLETIHGHACTDDAVVRDAYLNSALGVAGHPEYGPVFRSRREERVWPPAESKGE